MNNGFTTYERQSECGPTAGNGAAYSAILSAATLTGDPMTERSKRIWSAGDYDRISAGFRHEAQAFVQRQSLTTGMQVLDAACGSGNLTIPAARTGACVTGFDLVSSLLDATAVWAARENLDITLDQGTVEELPYRDAQFDMVMSMFGVMFAARPERVMAELTRVTRPGGRVVLANWTRSGFIGQMLGIHVAFVPPPAGAASPLLWGDEEVIRQRFDNSQWQVSTTLRTLTFNYPYSPAGSAELFCNAYGPTVRTLEALEPDQRTRMIDSLSNHWQRHHKAGAPMTAVDSEYLEVVAVRR